MKETLYTIPLTDALNAEDECPFCFIERNLEQDAIRFILGESYMESDVREETDRQGFCRSHMKMMYEYGNYLGSAWILSTRMKKLNSRFDQLLKDYQPAKSPLFGKLARKKTDEEHSSSPIAAWVREEEQSCYFCNRVKTTYVRYLDTFFYLLKKDPDFLQAVKDSKGFCLHHFGDLMDAFETKLSVKEKEVLAPVFLQLMQENLSRIQEDICWFIEKYDYRNKDADWKNSKDAVPRTMQKMAGGYPADPPFAKTR